MTEERLKELSLENKAPEILCKMGLRHDAKVMIKAHNEILTRKARAVPTKTDHVKTQEQADREEKNRQKQLRSSFTQKEYRDTARGFLEKVLPKAKAGIEDYDKALKEATEKYKAVSAELAKCKQDLEKCKAERKEYCRELNRAVIEPFIYANSGGNVLHNVGKVENLYPQLSFYVPSHNFEPIDHIEYMLSFIKSLDNNGK